MSTRSRLQTADNASRPVRSAPAAGPARGRSAPAADPARARRCTEALRDIAEDCTVVSESLLLNAYSADAPNTELLQLLVNLRELVDEAVGVVVVRQRAQGEPLAELEPTTGLTQDRLRKKYNPASVDRALAARRRPRPATPAHSNETATGAPTLRHPRQRLAAALTRMKEGSGHRQRQLAVMMDIDESYASRMLSGQRTTHWKYAKTICEACGVEPELMKPLWEVAAGVQPPETEDPVTYLRTYLQGLHYAFGSPDPQIILAAAQHALSADDLDRALHGPGVPDWPVIDRLTFALQSLPNVARPLWRRAQSAAENSPTDTHS
ncbi:helix-turn-helix domain-containing protein [Streptomyces sp. NPDC003247]|uniref:helix-turn-helix domain-containing protein n=1 Tax=Streptomyces sp. NPDC003247 TaxID=3364677 RepID=UPI003684B289